MKKLTKHSSGKRNRAKRAEVQNRVKNSSRIIRNSAKIARRSKKRGKRQNEGGSRVKMPFKLEVRIFDRDSDGELYAKPTQWKSKYGSIPTVLVLPDDPTIELPDVGDVVDVRIVDTPCGDLATHSGKIVKSRKANQNEFLAIIENSAGRMLLSPVERKGNTAYLSDKNKNEAEIGDLVVAEITDNGMQGRVKRRICAMDSEYAVSQIALEKFEIPYTFSENTLTEAAAAKPAGLKGRDDWRSVKFITIDPPDAKDHDDAVFAEADADQENPDGFVLYVAIADVSYYVRPDSSMDREAKSRGNSVYFPDRVIPMLPERISNDLCSLRENEDRPAMAVRMVFDKDGRKKSQSFHRVVMRSHAKLSYEQAQLAIDGTPDSTTEPILESVLQPLWRAYSKLSLNRENRAPLDLDLPEKRIILNAKGKVDRIVVRERLDAHRLIEECMIQANVAAAETLQEKGSALLYRIHDTPSQDRLESLRELLSSIDIKLTKGGNLRPSSFNNIIRKVSHTPHAPLVNEVILRSQAQAEYNPTNIGHFGLNLMHYAHFTSPIRRYADLTVHRGLISALKLGDDGQYDGFAEHVESLGTAISGYERRAMAAERETVDRLAALWLSERKQARYSGRISGVVNSGLFVELDEIGIDGYIPVAKLGWEYYEYDESKHALVGEVSGEGYRLGDSVDVRIAEVRPYTGSIRLDMLSEGRKIKSTDNTKGKIKNKRAKRGKPARRAAKGRKKIGRKR